MNVLVACQCKKSCIGGVGDHLPVHIINGAGEQVLAQSHILRRYGIDQLHYLELDPACPQAPAQYASWGAVPNDFYDMIVLMGCPIYSPVWEVSREDIENVAAGDGYVFHSFFHLGWDKLRAGGTMLFHPIRIRDAPTPETQARIFRAVVIPLFTKKPWNVDVREQGTLPVVIADESHVDVPPYDPHSQVICCVKSAPAQRRATRRRKRAV